MEAWEACCIEGQVQLIFNPWTAAASLSYVCDFMCVCQSIGRSLVIEYQVGQALFLELFWGKEALKSWLLVVFLREEPGPAVSQQYPTLLLCACHQWELGGSSAECSWILGGTDGTLLWDQHLETHRLQWDWGQFPGCACLRPEDTSFGRVGSHVPEWVRSHTHTQGYAAARDVTDDVCHLNIHLLCLQILAWAADFSVSILGQFPSVPD